MPRKNLMKSDEQERRLQQIKRDLCYMLQRIHVQRGWSARQMAIRLGTTQSRLSHALGSRVDKVTFNQLFNYLIIAI